MSLLRSPGISLVSDRAASDSLSGGVLGGHETQKGRQLTNVFDLAPVPDAGQHWLATIQPIPRNGFQILKTLEDPDRSDKSGESRGWS